MSRPEVFVSYSRIDEIWADRLVRHLRVLEKGLMLRVWADRQISAGREWFEEIQSAIDTASIAVLLVSADFLGSDFILGEEVPRLLERRVDEGMAVIPILVRDCAWEEITWLSALQIRPRSGQPLANRGSRIDTELKLVVREILGLVREKSGTKLCCGNGSRISPSGPSRG